MPNRTTGVHYLYAASYEAAAEVTLELRLSSGATSTVTATLPTTISADKIYTINVSATKASVSTSDWGYSVNDDDNQYPTDTITIDTSRTSGLPDVATIANDGLSIKSMPYSEANFTLALNSDDPIELYGNDRCVVEEVSTNIWSVTLKRSAINDLESDVVLYIRRKNLSVAYGETITLVQDMNPITASGVLADCVVAGTSKFEATKYVDSELLEFITPDGYTISAESSDSSREWLRAAVVDDRYVIQAGFRPNDTESDGSPESGRIIFTLPDGSTDVYEISRPNWGIPVVWFNGNYWSKFNLRGNPNNIEDQLRVSDPLSSISDLYTYIKSCSSADFTKIAGDTYVGQLSTPLTLASSSSSTLFSDYDLSSIPEGHINNTTSDHNAPDGFRRPSWDDMGTLFMSGDPNLTITSNEASGVYNTAANTTHPTYRQNINGYTGILGLYQMMKLTAAVSSNQSEPIVFTGYGAQWSDTGYTTIINMYPAYEETLPSTSTTLMWTYASGTYNTKQYDQPYSSNYYVRVVKTAVPFTY